MRLPSEAEGEGYRLVSVDATGSTNEDAMRAAREGDPGLLWIVAGRQHAGRGRHGRAWASPAGNLHASLLLIEPCELSEAAQLGFLAGLALHEAAAAVTGVGPPRVALKWPNDLLVDGAKAAGLLLEAQRIGGGGVLAVVIGFGVNVAAAPAETPYPARTLRALASQASREDLFLRLSASFAHRFRAWRDGAHDVRFEALRRAWLERAAGLGADVTVRLPAGPRTGRFVGLDDAGRLQLDTPHGLERIDAGDLYFPNLWPS